MMRDPNARNPRNSSEHSQLLAIVEQKMPLAAIASASFAARPAQTIGQRVQSPHRR
jgi:hypothetical protein